MSIFLTNEDNEQEVKETLSHSKVSGDFMSLTLSSKEDKLKKALIAYNQLCEHNMPNILQWTYIDLYNACQDKSITRQDWRNFLTDSRVQNWINEETQIIMKTKQLKLLETLGTDRSTATAQALNILVKANENDSNKIDDGKIFIYSFMPLTNEEKRLNNVQILRAIPDEVKSALQYISPDSDTN